MASTKVRGITIELGADTSGLSKALKGVNSEIGKTQKDLKDVERLLKLDPKNTELLEQKQRLLNDAVSETKTKLDALKQAQASLDMSTDEGQRQYDALTREIVSCENELKNAETAAKSFNVTAEKISATAGKMSQKFGSLAEKTRGLSMAAGGALAGMAGLAVKAGKDADELTTLSKQTGVATSELQKMQYAADLIDVDTETITGGLRKLKKNLDGHEESWEKVGVKVKDANGQYKDITSIFYETVKGLSQIENETERDIVAMDLFGKSADELAGVIDDGGEALKSLGEEAENMGVIISDEDLEKANELNDTLDRLKAEIMPTLMQLGIQIAEAIMPYIPKIQESVERVLSVLRNISPHTIAIVGSVLALTSALSPMFSLLSSVTGVVSKLAPLFSAVTSSAGGLSGVLGAISLPIIGIVAAIGTLVAAFKHLWDTNEQFKNNILGTWSNIKAMFDEFGQGIVDRLNNMGFDFQKFSDVVKAIWDGLCNFLAPVFEGAFQIIEVVLKTVLDALMGLFDIFAGLFTGNWKQVWTGIKEFFGAIWDAILGILKNAINGITGFINTLISGINKIGTDEHHLNIPLIPQLAEGGILTSGTAIVGEAGPELVQVSNGQAMVQPLSGSSNLEGLLQTYLPYLAAGQQMVLDSGALVGGIAPDMNTALGRISIRSGNR
ncbi:MAG: hypothetical protein IIZ78_20540 [Clostridiales bacterium]|nr:hypothetical protein [Clostridiales bacterium]